MYETEFTRQVVKRPNSELPILTLAAMGQLQETAMPLDTMVTKKPMQSLTINSVIANILIKVITGILASRFSLTLDPAQTQLLHTFVMTIIGSLGVSLIPDIFAIWGRIRATKTIS